ncbi:16S rRNA methyltransferase [Marinosulfonomonas sp. PRT-SC04]|nr:16S rRNA methyltransferase [Marinosulfonomonas sp. PRT-SC04]
MEKAKIRLCVTQALAPGQTIPLDRDESNYLFGVMRLKLAARVLLFNGVDGEYLAEVTAANKRNGTLICLEKTRPLQMPPDLWLLFAPIKKARTDFIVEKAAEMGAAKIMPVQTQFTNSDRIRQDRLQAHALEATEQCGGTYVPEVSNLQKLDTVLNNWPTDRQLIFCDEALSGAKQSLQAQSGIQKWAILIGPEGGFSDAERAKLSALPFVTKISLGPRILRADTAAVGALTLWQSTLGDW